MILYNVRTWVLADYSQFYLRIRVIIQHVLSLVGPEGPEALLTAAQDVPDVPVFPPLTTRPRHHCALPALPAPSDGQTGGQQEGESDRESSSQEDPGVDISVHYQVQSLVATL